MMRRLSLPRLMLLAALLAWPAGCSKSSGTYVRLLFSGAVSQVAPIQTITVTLQLGEKTASTAFPSPGVSGIMLPTDAVIEIGSGEGNLLVSALALAVDGTILGAGAGSGVVVRDQTVDVGVVFGTTPSDENQSINMFVSSTTICSTRGISACRS